MTRNTDEGGASPPPAPAPDRREEIAWARKIGQRWAPVRAEPWFEAARAAIEEASDG